MKRHDHFLPVVVALILTGLLLAPGQSVIAHERPVIQGAFIEFPPLAYVNASGQAEGSFIRQAEQIADCAGYDIHWKQLPIGRVYLYLENGNIDMWIGSAGVPELEDYTLETDFHVRYISLNAYHRRETPAIEEIDELKGNNLILIRGYTYWRILDHLKEDSDTTIAVAPDHHSAIRMLKFKRGDYLVNFQSPMGEIISEHPFPGLQSSKLLEWPLTFVFSRKPAHTRQMVEDFNQAWRSFPATERP